MKKSIKRKSPSARVPPAKVPPARVPPAKVPPHGDARQHPNGHASQPPHGDARQPVGPDITDLVNKISQQLVFLEKKIDTLISQSSERPSHRFDETQHRRFDRPHRYDQGNQDNRPRERTFTQATCAECKKTCEVPFKPSGDRPVYCSECFAKRKGGDSFKGNRDNRRPFTQPGRGNQGFDRRKKPFSRQSHPVGIRRKPHV